MTLSSGAFNLAQIAADVVNLRFQSSCTSVTSARTEVNAHALGLELCLELFLEQRSQHLIRHVLFVANSIVTPHRTLPASASAPVCHREAKPRQCRRTTADTTPAASTQPAITKPFPTGCPAAGGKMPPSPESAPVEMSSPALAILTTPLPILHAP